MTVTQAWETSPAYEQHYAERRHHVAKLLEQWGSVRNTEWPDDARFVTIKGFDDQALMWRELVNIGRASIQKHLPGWKLAELFPQRTWDEATHDVYFTEVTNGNVHKQKHSNTLAAFILSPAGNYVRCVILGCGHPYADATRQSSQYTEYRCPHCNYTWGVDTSG